MAPSKWNPLPTGQAPATNTTANSSVQPAGGECDIQQDDSAGISGLEDRSALAADTLTKLLQSHLPTGVEWTVSQVKWKFQFVGLTVEVSDENSNGIAVTASSDEMPRKRLDPLRQELRAILARALNELSWSAHGFGVMLLQLAEEAHCHIEDFRNPKDSSKKPDTTTQGWNSSVHDVSGILKNDHGVDLKTVNDTARHILGQSISEILSDIPGDLRAATPRTLRNEWRSTSPEPMSLSMELEERSIVRYGFLLPGTKIGETGEKLEMRFNNAWFGKGIYSSPSLNFAADFGEFDDKNSNGSGWRSGADIPGMRVLVCATLMGLSLKVSRAEVEDTVGLDNSNAHSHVSPDGMEYVVFDPAQILPCYVLHIDFGADVAHQIFNLTEAKASKTPALSRVKTDFDDTDDSPGAKVAKKEALKAQAMKWLPHGFGTATGTNFVVEEIADVSDDEEEVGEFQAMRGEQESEGHSWQKRSAEETSSWFDEYQNVRTSNKDVRVARK
ncbi:hypothetical protein PRZ48_007132 [Zasmidium cellare]|uniref:Uncharacterized protein n=1 Tax=Zasmidium cellare TaxID=395010 RepID=A0ABR0EIK2_ZASCE|nr:hypothetical protein PRZ48_007132 [Zasmidium cellare]